jgi:hypothetical protein
VTLTWRWCSSDLCLHGNLLTAIAVTAVPVLLGVDRAGR